MSAQNFLSFFLTLSTKISQTQSRYGHDETYERDHSEVRLQFAAEQKRTPDRSSCRRVMPEPPAKMVLAKSVKYVSSFPKKEAKTAGVFIAARTRLGGRRRIIAQES